MAASGSKASFFRKIGIATVKPPETREEVPDPAPRLAFSFKLILYRLISLLRNYGTLKPVLRRRRSSTNSRFIMSYLLVRHAFQTTHVPLFMARFRILFHDIIFNVSMYLLPLFARPKSGRLVHAVLQAAESSRCYRHLQNTPTKTSFRSLRS